jgi:acyl carrier protein
VITPERAVEVVAEVLRHKGAGDVAVAPESVLADLGLDSLDLAEALLILEEDEGVELDEHQGLRTVADLTRLTEAGP